MRPSIWVAWQQCDTEHRIFASLQAGMRQYLAEYAYSNASAEQLLQALMAALLNGAANRPANADQKPLCAPSCLLPEDDFSGSVAGLGSAVAGLGSNTATSELIAAAAELINPLLYSAGYAEVSLAAATASLHPSGLKQSGCVLSAAVGL